MSKRFTFSFVVVVFAVIGLLPILQMFVNSVIVNGQISLVNYKSLLSSSRAWALLKNSLELSLLTTMIAVVVGVPMGLVTGKTDMPFKSIFKLLFVIPLLIPPYITAVAWFSILGREGFLSKMLGSEVAANTSSFLFGLPGCVLVLSTTFMPIVMFLTATYAKTLNTHLEEAARLVAPWKTVAKGIIVPMILPGIFLSAVLVFLLSLGEFSVPMFLRYDVFPVESFTQFSAFYNYSAGTAFVIPLIIIAFLILLGERRFLRDKTYQLKPASGEEPLVIKLGKIKWPLFICVVALCFVAAIMPILALIIQSATFATYVKAFEKSSDSLSRSIAYAVIGATLLTSIGVFFGYLIHKKEFSYWRAVDSVTIFLFALPSTVVGIGLAGLWNRPLTNVIYGTAAIIILGYIAQYTALTSRILVSSFAQLPPSMEEAAQNVGAGWFRRIALILAPLAKRGLLAAWLVGYIFCLKDTGISMIVYPPGHDTFPVRTFTLMANSPTNFIAALCVIMIVATLLPMGLLGFLYRSKQGV
jgi:iron(III) transport system permease protein